MPRASREYITADVSTVPIEIHHRNREIAEELQRVAAGRTIGWQVIGLRTVAEIEEEGLDSEEVLRVSGGRLPIIFVNVTFLTEEMGGDDLGEWESAFGLRLLGEAISRE